MSGSMSQQPGQRATRKAGVKPIPQGFHSVTPYLMVNGAAKVIEFLKKGFGASEVQVMPGENGKIMHASIRIGDSTLMLADGMGEGEHKAMPVMLYLYVEDADQTFRQAIQAGGIKVKDVEDQFYGDRAGCVKDPAGNTWWIATQIEEVSLDELRRRQAAMQKH